VITHLQIRIAGITDTAAIQEMLREAAEWVDALGVVMWEVDELAPERVANEVAAGQFVIAESRGEPAGALRFQTEDLLFWPDIPQEDSAFVHRLVVSRRFKGQGVSTALLRWAVDRARVLRKRHLRLDCDESRPKLRALYEHFGFRVHSFRQVGPYYVARYEYDVRVAEAQA
jgi:GNAT superfamily N-acetyltransferase